MSSYFSFRTVAVVTAVLAIAAISAKVVATRKSGDVADATVTRPCREELMGAEIAHVDSMPFCAVATKSEPAVVAAAVAAKPAQTGCGTTVLKVANSYKNGGGFNWDAGTGTPDEIRFKGVRILSKAKSGTYCCGFTFAVAMRSAAEAGLLQDKSVRQIRRFQQHWYAATPEAKEKQQIFAIQWLGIGREVPLMQAEPGDFVRLWHGSSGHSVVLVRWVVENGNKVGIEYRGTQSNTDGIGNHVEYMGGAPGHGAGFIPERTYAARLNAGAN